MKLWEALKIHEETGRKIRPVGLSGFNFQPAEYWFGNFPGIDRKFALMGFWEVEPLKVEVSREMLFKVWHDVAEESRLKRFEDFKKYGFETFCERLGL